MSLVPASRSHVINLRNPGREELDGAGNQIFASRPPQARRRKCSSPGRGRGCWLPRRWPCGSGPCFGSGLSRRGCRCRAGASRPGSPVAARADVDHADAVVRIEHGDAVLRTNRKPVSKRFGIARKERMQNERRKREIVDPIDLAARFPAVADSGCGSRPGLPSRGVGLAK